ncbi:MAG: hypothetical protein ACLQBD_20765 [Syntrophobacteraceae bacterium]
MSGFEEFFQVTEGLQVEGAEGIGEQVSRGKGGIQELRKVERQAEQTVMS